MVEIIVAVVTGAATVLTVLLTNNRSNRDMNSKLEKSQAVTDTKLDELTREVRLHNSFAQRIPVVEEQIKAVNRRINDLEKRIN
ncbi:MAG: hypothetical protein IJF27_02725 [Oscillospiraceae bacterium]|nr:hypothetical protein [Oscillospiraceae bacterium]MBQ9938795.1 hypothetical protein [Oscillospiraceae bacterium]